jgi:phenylpropionate dioxygenase-like ring-hydroxylating dioxygenase large terminal subunit
VTDTTAVERESTSPDIAGAATAAGAGDHVHWHDNVDPALRACWHPIGTVAELDAGDGILGVTLLGERFVVARLAGRLVAFPDECPHRLAPLSAGTCVGATLQCAYHGYRFDHDGRCVEVPALGSEATIPPRAALRPVGGVAERYGLVWLSVDPPLTPLPDVPEHDDPRYGVVHVPPQTWSASAAQMADNFLDVAHFPFTHLATIGNPDDREVAPYRVERDGWRFRVAHRHVAKGLDDSVAQVTDSFETGERLISYECTAPHHVYLRIEYPADDVTIVITFFHQPIDATTTRLYAHNIRNDLVDGRCTPEETIRFQQAVGTEDRLLLERFPRKAIPLDHQREVHTRADRITLELRRMLGELVVATRRDLGARP